MLRKVFFCNRIVITSSRRSFSNEKQRKDFLEVYNEVISRDEEEMIVKYLAPILARRRYEGNHWDAVISKYKEIELINSYRIPPQVQSTFDRLLDLIREKCQLEKNSTFLSPHVIDLAEDGHIGKFKCVYSYCMNLFFCTVDGINIIVNISVVKSEVKK
jgi:hypothetical protein